MTAVVVLAGCVLASCARGGPSVDDGRLRAVAGFFPLAEAVRRVGGDRVSVRDLTPPGAEPHDLEITTDELDAIEDADLVVFLGGGFQPAVEAASKRARGATIDVFEGVAGSDLHVWLDPVEMAGIVVRVRDALVAVEPASGGRFSANAATYLAELSALDRSYATALARCDRRTIVTAHEAFGRLAQRYDLVQVSIAGRSPESEADPRRLAELADRIRAEGATTVFTEALVPPDVANALAREAGVRARVLDPLEGLSPERTRAGIGYDTVMRENLAVLTDALGCR